jgi:short-subunit dehydrogenase
VGHLVNNAGYSLSGAIETLRMDALRKQFETNVFGLVRLTQLVLPKMREQRSGRIINISSMGGTLVFPGGGAYHATKYAVEAISDALRFEVAGFGIQVVIIQPGLIRTGFADAVAREMKEPDGPYAAFDAHVKKATHDAYNGGSLSRFGGDSDSVAKVIETALTASRPRTRYTVTPSAWMLMGARRWVSDRAWDSFMANSYPRPG